ncbi:hypothetical protein Q0F99_01650 [Rathayibacter oskolensis]|nr:hypothetical protein [Rathayibacter oskolensis]WKK71883.1 hypothetical protein Q0F99_01650 [Rathayibacter oskolensis]
MPYTVADCDLDMLAVTLPQLYCHDPTEAPAMGRAPAVLFPQQ